MASHRSKSPSTPSEGEIIESGSETKATTSHTSLNDINVDRNTRTDVHSPKSPASVSRSYRRERTRSRSPYQRPRGGEKRRYEEYDYEKNTRNNKSSNSRYDDRYYNSGGSSKGGGARRQNRRPYYDHDRTDSYDRGLPYNDDYYRRPDKRPRTRSRSPYRDSRDGRRYSGNELNVKHDKEEFKGHTRREDRLSREQSVSERGEPSVAARNSKQEAENRGSQMQQTVPSTDIPTSSNTQAQDTHTANGVANEPVDEAILIEQRRKRREAIKAKYRDQAPTLLVQALTATGGGSASTPQTESEPIAVNTDEQGSRQASPLNTPAETPGSQSPTDLDVSMDDDLANTDLRNRSGLEREEQPSAADYDPTSDMREDKRRHDKRHFGSEVPASAYDETKPAKQDVLVPENPKEQKTSELKSHDAFDMFADDDDDMFAEETTSKPTDDQAVPKPSIATAQELDMSMMDNWDDPEGYYNVMLGELINGRYHVQQHLGKGMFSSVVRAVDSTTGNQVAVKIVRNNDTMRRAGLKEIEILQQLRFMDPDDKKHIIRFDRQFDHKGHLCMVFENLSMNLREVLKKFGRDVGINLRAIRAYAQQMFLGLSLFRKCNILHADLKPDNLLVNENRNLLKICDLGSASPASENEITPYLVSRFYRAPEIILGIPYDYGLDMWSIGCTLFELYSGKILFTGRNNNQMLRSIMECRGKFPPKFLRRGTLTHLHFDDMLNFRSLEEDKITGRMTTKVLDFKKPIRDLKSRLVGRGARLSDSESKEITLFIDLLEKCLHLNPEKRCTPSEALKHPFIAKGKI